MACGEPRGAACGQGAEDRCLARARRRPVRNRRAVRDGVGALALADLADVADHRGARRRAGRRRDGGGGGGAVVGAGAALLARLCRGIGTLLGCERDELGRGAHLRAPRREAPQRRSSAAPHSVSDPHHPTVLRGCATCGGTARQVDATAAGRRVLTLRPLHLAPTPYPFPLSLLLTPTSHCTLQPWPQATTQRAASAPRRSTRSTSARRSTPSTSRRQASSSRRGSSAAAAHHGTCSWTPRSKRHRRRCAATRRCAARASLGSAVRGWASPSRVSVRCRTRLRRAQASRIASRGSRRRWPRSRWWSERRCLRDGSSMLTSRARPITTMRPRESQRGGGPAAARGARAAGVM